MIPDLVKLMTVMFSMRRWNNRPTLEYNSEASNSGFVLHTAHLLGMMEKYKGNRVDMSKILVRCTLKDMPKCIISDISLSTKRSIQTLSPETWDKLYKSSVDEVIKYVPDRLKMEFKDAMMSSRDESIEGKIVNAADIYAAYAEAEINNRLFPEYFKVPLESIEEKMREIKLDSFKLLIENDRLKSYLSQIRTLMYAIRWNQHPRTVQTTVAGHTFFVVFVSYLMARESDNVNILNVLERSLFHDVPEALTGDIISPTKRRVEGFEKVVEDVESKMVHELLLPLLPESIADHCAPLMLRPFDDSPEGRITKASDLISSLTECKMEIDNGMQVEFFKKGYESIKAQLDGMNLDVIRNVLIQV
jgi:putative hydrolase of HD superfamily